MNRRKITSIAAAVALAVGGLGVLAASAATPGPAGQTYTPVTPVRICDTRGGTQVPGGCTAGQVKPGGSVTVSPDAAGISGESAVVLNVTATGSSGGGNITVDPAGTAETKTSNLNYTQGQTIPNLVIVPVGTGDGVTLYNNSGAGVQLIVDLEGYFTGPSPAPTTTSASPSPTQTTASASPTPTPTGTGTGTVSSPLGIPGSWALDKADEFNGTSVDRSLWAGWFNATGGNPVNSGEDQGYSGANVTEPGDGYLHLTLSSTAGALVSSNPSDGVAGHTGYQFTGTAAAEARIYLPGTGSTVDNWPAFWTDGQSWPANGESDVMEGLGGATACHSHTSANQNASGNCPNTGPGWHTFGELWDATAQTVTYYYDGAQVGSAPFANGDAPNYLILDNTSSAGTGGPTVRNQDMLVDYVRVWKPTPPPPANPAHVVVVEMENHSYSDIIGSASAPYINALAGQGVLYTDDLGKSHPSLPNYLDLYSGSTQGQDGSDNCISSSANNIGEELGARNIREYAESLGTGSPASNSGEYACRHNGPAQFTDSASKGASTDFANFPTTAAGYAALPPLSYVTPNLIDDMHDGTMAQGDSWLQAHIDGYAQWAKANNSMLVVVWDENSGSDLTTPLPMFIVGQGVTAGSKATAQVGHDNLYRTLSDWAGHTPLTTAAPLPGLPVS